VFYSRHVRFLYGLLLRRKTDLLSLAGLSAEDLVQETFHRAFERAHTFQAAEDLDAARALARTRAWLSRVATNLLADQLHRLREISATPYLERVSCDAIDEQAPSSRPSRVDLVAQGLEELTEREQDVLRVSALYFKAGEEHNRLPNAVSADLAQRWQTTNENIRAVRARAMKKLKAFLTAKGLGTEEVS
jgi:RNA polymerase sigma factor (sigma-70 family)